MNWNFGSFKGPMVDNNKKYSNRLNQVIKLHHIWSIFMINCYSFVSKFEKWSKNDNFWLFWASYKPLCWPMKTFIPIVSVRWLGYIMLNLFFSCNAEICKANVKKWLKSDNFRSFWVFYGCLWWLKEKYILTNPLSWLI